MISSSKLAPLNGSFIGAEYSLLSPKVFPEALFPLPPKNCTPPNASATTSVTYLLVPSLASYDLV